MQLQFSKVNFYTDDNIVKHVLCEKKETHWMGDFISFIKNANWQRQCHRKSPL